jgi:hypothetical protein
MSSMLSDAAFKVGMTSTLHLAATGRMYPTLLGSVEFLVGARDI